MGVFCFLSLPAMAQRMPQDSWYLAKEMKRFVEPGKFYHPHDAALGPDGNLYVADRYNHRVQVFDQDGNFIRQFGNYGSGNGEFYEVTGIHVAPDGKVYVSEFNNHRVQVFDAQGKFIRAMGQNGRGEGQLNGPHGVTLDDDGNVYVVELYNARVSVFKPDGTYLLQWGSSGSGDGQFQGAIAICRAPDNKIAVLERDGNRRIQVFEPNGTFIRKFTTEWSPHGIEADSAGNFYVTATAWAGFSVFSSDGTRTAVLAQNGGGSGDGQFNPFGLAVGNGKVFCCDWTNHRIAVFSTDGTWIKNFGTHQSSDHDTLGIAVDADGNIFISYHGANVIYKFSPDLAFIKSFGSAGSGDGQFNGVLEMAIGPNNRLYVVDHSGHRVQYFDLEGNFLGKFGSNGTGNGNFNYPWGIAVSKDNKVYVADRDNHRIQVFDANGNFLSKFGSPGSFDEQFQSPYGLAIAPNGDLAVADYRNCRIQLFNSSGAFYSKIALPSWGWDGAHPVSLRFSSDGLLHCSDDNMLRTYDRQGTLLKEWGIARAPMAETKSGDLIAAHGDRVVRVWKRTFRTVHPDPSNAIPLPTILSQSRRPGTSLVDVEYTVKDADDATVQTGALAFKNGGNSLSDVIPIKSLAEGTGSKLGSNITTGQTHRFTWNVAGDWNTDFAEVQLEILAKDNRDLLNLDFLRIPAGGDNPELKISRSPVNDNDFLSVWYWLLATGDPDVRLDNGQVLALDGSSEQLDGLVGETSTILAMGSTTTKLGRDFILQRMGLREATAAEVTRAKEAGTPGVINQWEPKLKVGPGERPAKVNAYGFDTGASGYWVVPVTNN